MRGIFAVAAAIVLAPGIVLAHGTGARIMANTATVVELYHTDGDPMAYAEAKVFSPEAPDVPFVNGRADKLGRVTFAADRDGVWRVEAHDNEGHSVRTEVTVASNAVIDRHNLGGNPWLLWASLFVNVFAVVTLIQSRPAIFRTLKGASI